MNYRVTWTMDIESDSPQHAAQLALTIHRDPNSIATVFEVTDEQGDFYKVDLLYGLIKATYLVHHKLPTKPGEQP